MIHHLPARARGLSGAVHGLVVLMALGFGDASLAARREMVLSPALPDYYVQGRLAESRGELVTAIAAYRQAMASDPTRDTVAARAYRQAVIAGDRALAVRAAQALRGSDALPRDALLVLLLDALGRNDAEEARALGQMMEAETSVSLFAPFARSWASVIKGPYQPPVIGPSDAFAAYAMRQRDEQAMMQALVRGDGPSATQALDAMRVNGLAPLADMRVGLAERFAVLGEKQAALSLLGEPADGAGAALRARIEAGQKVGGSPSPLSAGQGIAALSYRLAMGLGGGARRDTSVLSLLRIASFGDPTSMAIRLEVARSLLTNDQAAAAFDQAGMIPQSAAIWSDAQTVRVLALVRLGRKQEATRYARALAGSQTAGVAEWRLLGDVLMQTDQFEEAAKAYDRAIALSADHGDARLLLQKGSALVQAGRWPEGRATLEQALALLPDEPVILNHLGYLLSERGEDLPRALAMLQKANAIRPDEPAYIDSLGWALFRSGQVDAALPYLERAAAAAPGEPDIQEHLGDALWATGRRFEARYSWTAARVNAEDEARKRLDAKLVGGLVIAPPSAAPPKQ